MYNTNINLNLYKTFLVVAKSKSLSDASNKLNIEKPSLSRNIKQLEDTLGIKLFYRDSKGMKLTAEGEELYEFVDKSLSLLETGEKIVQEKNDLSTGEITIGSLSHLSAFYVMDCIEKAKKDYPNLKIELVTGATGRNLIDLLENHKIDFAIDSTNLDIANKDIQLQELKVIDNIFISKEPLEITDIKQLENFEYILGAEYTATKYGKKHTKNNEEIGCDNDRVNNEVLKECFTKSLQAIVSNKEEIAKDIEEYIKGAVKKSENETKIIDILAKEKEQLNKEKNKLLDLCLKEIISEEMYRAKNNELENKIKKINKEISEQEDKKQIRDNIDEIIANVRKVVYNILSIKKFSKSVCRELVDKVVIYNARKFDFYLKGYTDPYIFENKSNILYLQR